MSYKIKKIKFQNKNTQINLLFNKLKLFNIESFLSNARGVNVRFLAFENLVL